MIVEPSVTIQLARNSLVTPMIKDKIKHETFDTSVVTSSKPYESPRANCGYVVAFNFFSSSESVE